MKATPNAETLVRSQHRASQWTPPLVFVAAGLALTLGLLWLAHPSAAPVADWHWLRAGWLGGGAATGAGALALWRARRRTLLRSAAKMDAALATHNRLETATALRGAQGAMAKAQRVETNQFLQQNQIAPRRRWWTASAVLAALLAVAHLATLICWARPIQGNATAKKAVPVVAVKNERPATPTASIQWRSPESETTATAIEEVPLEAEADSSTGLTNAVLEVEVNGAHRLSQPLTNDLTRPGPHALKPSLYLDQLDVKTYDIVSYHISAQRIAGDTLPPTVSPVQFVEVKPVREDTFVSAGGDQPGRSFNYVAALKAAQLRLMKDNFALAHADASRDNPEWRDQNSRVGGDQNQLAARTGEVVEMMRTNHYPGQFLALVRESQPLMADAGGKIVKKQNQPALQPQAEALARLTEVEKYLQNSMTLASAKSAQPQANDPFQRPRNLEPRTQPLTRAGQIDALAQAQAQLAGDLAAGNTNSTAKPANPDRNNPASDVAGTPGERQTKIKERIGDILNNPAIQPDALKHLQSGDDFAGQSQERIGENDFAAASEPAAEAARELRQASEALRSSGNRMAKDRLADALLQLSAAAGNARRAPQAKTDADAAAELKQIEGAIAQAANQLAAEAQRQQENGATNAFERLADMARLLQGQSLQQMLAQAQAAPRDAAQAGALAQKLDELAQRAGQQRNPGRISRQELAQLVERMQRAQANLENLASQANNPGSPPANGSTGAANSNTPNPARSNGSSPSPASANSTDGQSAHARAPEMSRADMQRAEGAQLLDELRLDAAEGSALESDLIYVKQLDRALRAAAQQPVRDPKDFAPLVLQINPPLTGVINALQTKLAGMRRQFVLASKEPEDAPPVYRDAVADYFEQVSRDYQPENGAH